MMIYDHMHVTNKYGFNRNGSNALRGYCWCVQTITFFLLLSSVCCP